VGILEEEDFVVFLARFGYTALQKYVSPVILNLWKNVGNTIISK